MKKFLYVATDGLYTEATAYETSDYISSSAGAGDAGKPIVLDAGGMLDASFIDDSDIDHGSIGGLADDDHLQYILVAGTRAFTGNQSFGGFKATSLADPTTSGDAVHYGYLISTATGKGASKVGVEDSAGYFTGTNVESVLAELYVANQLDGVSYTVDTGGVTKGDAVYVSANNKVKPYATISASQRVVGLAATTEIAAATVYAVTSKVLTGVLTGATFGTPYYWNGTTQVTTMPATSGDHVWQVGTAKNATDLHVDIRPIKVNA